MPALGTAWPGRCEWKCLCLQRSTGDYLPPFVSLIASKDQNCGERSRRQCTHAIPSSADPGSVAPAIARNLSGTSSRMAGSEWLFANLRRHGGRAADERRTGTPAYARDGRRAPAGYLAREGDAGRGRSLAAVHPGRDWRRACRGCACRRSVHAPGTFGRTRRGGR